MAGETYVTNLSTPGDAVASTWAAWTPVITATSGVPPLNSAVGRFAMIGKLVAAQFMLQMSGTTGTGVYWVNVPVTARYASDDNVGTGWMYDVAAGRLVLCNFRLDGNGTRIRPIYVTSTPASLNVDGTSPWTWAVNDIIQGALFYEAA